jgi:hypothetical protein
MSETRKIAAILAADVVDFIRMARADEGRTPAADVARGPHSTGAPNAVMRCFGGRRTRNDGECDTVGSAKLGGGNHPPGGNE